MGVLECHGALDWSAHKVLGSPIRAHRHGVGAQCAGRTGRSSAPVGPGPTARSRGGIRRSGRSDGLCTRLTGPDRAPRGGIRQPGRSDGLYTRPPGPDRTPRGGIALIMPQRRTEATPQPTDRITDLESSAGRPARGMSARRSTRRNLAAIRRGSAAGPAGRPGRSGSPGPAAARQFPAAASCAPPRRTAPDRPRSPRSCPARR